MSEQIDCAVIGAGVIGLAVGRALAAAGREVLVLERNEAIGEETSSRNSEVIHGGLYYPTGSLKARLCISGKAMLYAYCETKRIPCRRLGKLIVATAPPQLDLLDAVARQAEINGVEACELIDGAELRRREPAVSGVGAVWSPSTGIVDSHALMQALEGDLEAAGGMLALRTAIEAIDVKASGIRLSATTDGERIELQARTVVNAAGLDAGRLARQTTGTDGYAAPTVRLAKGSYFTFTGKSPFASLIYPLPEDGGLGIHATLDLAGQLRFGPDVEWVDTIDYSVDAGRRARFAESIRTYWPALRDEDLVAGYAGIRPKLGGPGEKMQDFRFDLAAGGPERQLMHLLGIESPGLTAALAIAEEVRARIEAAG